MVACRLGIVDKGITRLRIEVLEVPKRPSVNVQDRD